MPLNDARARSLVDAVGVEHPPASGPVRIVSLVPSITELLFHLGLADFIVGRTTFCVHPADGVTGVPRVGGTKHIKQDRVRALAPTHVIVNVDENTKEDVEELATFVPHVIVTHPIEPQDNIELFRLVGDIFGKGQAAERLCGDFQHALDHVTRGAEAFPHRDVLYLIWQSPWMTVSRETYISRMLSLVHWHTFPAETAERYPEVHFDKAVFDHTEIILFGTEPYPFREAHLEAFRAQFPNRRQTLALIDAEMVSWYGSRAVAGVKYLLSFARELAG